MANSKTTNKTTATKNKTKDLPVLNKLPTISSSKNGLQRYLTEIRRYPILKPDEEQMLAREWLEKGDRESAHKMVTSHLRLVARIAMGYRGYGLPMGEVISEGNVGLMQAVKKFDPDKGFRLATYAMWWIKASIQEYILRSWSLVKLGTTAAQKKLFFNLRRVKGEINAYDDAALNLEQIEEISKRLAVPHEEIVNMNQRLTGDSSLNAPLRTDNEGTGEWQDWLVDENADHEKQFLNRDEMEHRLSLLSSAMHVLNDREKEIFTARRLSDPVETLEELSQKFKVSRERIRQIEVRAFEKVQQEVQALAAKDAREA